MWLCNSSKNGQICDLCDYIQWIWGNWCALFFWNGCLGIRFKSNLEGTYRNGLTCETLAWEDFRETCVYIKKTHTGPTAGMNVNHQDRLIQSEQTKNFNNPLLLCNEACNVNLAKESVTRHPKTEQLLELISWFRTKMSSCCGQLWLRW